MSKLLEVKNLHVSVEDKEILKGVNLSVKEGESHVLMGPNGNGKSTLLAAIMGDPRYTVTQGSIFYDDKNILEMPVNERLSFTLQKIIFWGAISYLLGRETLSPAW